jgi:hypothetical protein
MYGLFRFLWSEEFVQLWLPEHFVEINEMLRSNYLDTSKLQNFFNSAPGINCFVALNCAGSYSSKSGVKNFASTSVIQTTLNMYGEIPDVINIFTQAPYAPYYLLQQIEKDTFRKTTDYTKFNTTLQNTSTYDLAQLSKHGENKTRFMEYLRFIDILKEDDPKKVEATKLITMIFSLEEFKAFNNQSLQVFDNDSKIEDEPEEIVDEYHKVNVHVHSSQNRQEIRNLDTALLFQEIQKDSKLAQDLIKQFKITDFMFFRGPEGETAEAFLRSEDSFLL